MAVKKKTTTRKKATPKKAQVVKQTAPPPAVAEADFFAAIQQMAVNPDIDAEKIQKLVNIQEQILDRNNTQAFNLAMVAAQREMPEVIKDKDNTQTTSKYASYEAILKDCKEVYTKHGLSVMFYEGKAETKGEVRVFADILHDSGHSITKWADIPLDNKGIKGTVNKTGPHAKGSCFTYGRSYLLRLIFNISTTDGDDGNAAGGAPINLEAISEKEVSQVISMIDEIDAQSDKPVDIKSFLNHVGAESIQSIPKKNYKLSMGALSKRLRKAENADN